jgi:hypothetical protein
MNSQYNSTILGFGGQPLTFNTALGAVGEFFLISFGSVLVGVAIGLFSALVTFAFLKTY